MSPTIAYINNYFPGLSYTFIYKEVIGLRKRNVSIKTFSIRKPELNSLSEESLHLYHSTIFIFPLRVYEFAIAHLYYFGKYPLKYIWIILFLLARKYKNRMKDRVRTLFHFCEGVYFAKLIKDNADIKHIHAHYVSHPATIAMVASILTKIPFSITAHATDIWDDRLFVKEKVNAAKFVITCSEYGRKAILNLDGIINPEKVKTIYHGVDIEKFRRSKPVTESSKTTILTVGRLHQQKAQDELILACKLLKDEDFDFQCYIVGEGPHKDYLEGIINKNQLQENVRLVGKVVQENIKDYYENADIFVLPSVSENLPNVLLESLAMGVPVIATNIAGIPELIKDKLTGVLVKPHDIQGLAVAIKMLIRDGNLRRTISENGKDFVCQNFDDEKCIDQMVNLFHSYNVVAD